MARKSFAGMKMHKYRGPRGDEIQVRNRPRKRAGKTIVADLLFLCLIGLGVAVMFGGIFHTC